jgi:hypothetical protein
MEELSKLQGRSNVIDAKSILAIERHTRQKKVEWHQSIIGFNHQCNLLWTSHTLGLSDSSR